MGGGLQVLLGPCKMLKVLHETLLLAVFMYGSEIMIWKEEEWFGVVVVRMKNLKGLMGIRRMDNVPSARIRELCGVTKV